MAIKQIDTNEIEDISKRIIELSKEYNNEINRLFKRLGDVPNITKEWVGNQAKYYFDSILLEKDSYLEFASILRDYGLKLKEDCVLVDSEVRNIMNKEIRKN